MVLSHQPMRKDHDALPFFLSPTPQIKEWTAQDSCRLEIHILVFSRHFFFNFQGKKSVYDKTSWLRAEHGVRMVQASVRTLVRGMILRSAAAFVLLLAAPPSSTLAAGWPAPEGHRL
jgi:hypothetical protein